MVKSNNELGFAMSDLYPNYGGVDTSTLANPEADDQQALNENPEVADKAVTPSARKKNIFLALGVLLALIVFFGGGK